MTVGLICNSLYGVKDKTDKTRSGIEFQGPDRGVTSIDRCLWHLLYEDGVPFAGAFLSGRCVQYVVEALKNGRRKDPSMR